MADVRDLEDMLDEDERLDDLSDAERAALADTTVELDETSQAFVDKLIDKLMVVCDEISGHPLRKYQKPFARRVFESLIINDGATITALFARQTGKSETVANCIATAMIMLPILAKVFPDLLDKFEEGVWVGRLRPGRRAGRHAVRPHRLPADVRHAPRRSWHDPEIGAKVLAKGRTVWVRFRSIDGEGSLVRKTTAHPRATIEGRSYHIILIDECQGADDRVVNKSHRADGRGLQRHHGVHRHARPTPRTSSTPRSRSNKRALTQRGSSRCNHFEVDWRTAARENANYRKFVNKEMLRMGEDSDEFKLSYRLVWLLDKGMFTTSARSWTTAVM